MSNHNHAGPSGDHAQETTRQIGGGAVGNGGVGFSSSPSPSASSTSSSSNVSAHPSLGTTQTPSETANPTGGHSVTDTTSNPIQHPTTNQASSNLGMNPSGANPGGWNESAGSTGATSTNSGNPANHGGGNWNEGSVGSAPTSNPTADSSGTIPGFSNTGTSDATSTPAPSNTNVKLGKGLDVGTANLVTAVQNEQGGITIKMERNAFIDIDADVYSKRMLTKLQVPYVVHNDRMVVLGDSAFELSNIFSRETRRPMKDGLISPSEVDALGIIRLIIDKILGAPRGEGEKVYFSVPAASIDRPNNVIYHQGLFEGLVRKMGYVPHAMNEAHAVVFSELAEQNFTGIGISCGGGMFNVCVAYKTIPALTFSICRGGDWIDQNVANVLGIPSSKATSIKERGVDLMNPQNREEEAVVIYYRNLINYTLINIKNKFEVAQDMPEFPEPIEIVFSGGTSMIGGFAELCDEELKKINFPIPVSRIRRAKDPLSSVARGCLIAAAIGE